METSMKLRGVRVPGLRPAGALVVAAFLVSPAAYAQDRDPAPADADGILAADDSTDLLDRAREAQRRFEHLRRRHLPTTVGWGSRECDDQVGRMCWTHETGSLWTPEPEDEEVEEAREELLADLGRIAETLPGDEWVLGQRVWYLVEAGRTRDALAAARTCGGPATWWCMALEGLALHLEGRYPEAERAFDRALAAMDPERAREWREVRPLLEGDVRGALDDAAERSPAARDTLVDLLWRLSDPLHLVPGNERRTEHLARRTVARIRSEAHNPHGIPWGDDLAELLIRYGWGVGWERVPREPGRLGDSGSVIGHEHPESRGFMPPGSVLRDATAASAEHWVPRLEYTPSAYAPAYAPVVLPMDSRIAVLHRGDRALVAATWSLPADTTRRGGAGVRPEHRRPAAFQGEPVRAGLFLASPETDTIHAARAEDASRGVLVLDVPAGSYWASVEVLDPGIGRAGRLRRGLEIPELPPDAARVSDLLLLEPGPLPDGTGDALRRLAVHDTVAPGEAMVVAWELHGLGWREEVIGYRLGLEREGGGFFRRVGETLGLVDGERPRVLEWEEPGPDRPGPTFRSVAMDIGEVEPGLYRLRLEVTTRGRSPMVTERTIVVEAQPRR